MTLHSIQQFLTSLGGGKTFFTRPRTVGLADRSGFALAPESVVNYCVEKGLVTQSECTGPFKAGFNGKTYSLTDVGKETIEENVRAGT